MHLQDLEAVDKDCICWGWWRWRGWLILIFSNYWMRLSRIWRILQIKKGVIHRSGRPRWITSSEICRILHILRKPNSIIALLFIQNIYSFLKEFRHFALCFSAHLSLSPGFRGQRFNNLQRAALLTSFWRQWFNNFRRAPLLTSLIQYGGDSFQIWWTAAGYGELSVWFWPIRNGEIFWMNDNITYFAVCWCFFDMPNSVSFFVLTWMNIDSLTKVCIL